MFDSEVFTIAGSGESKHQDGSCHEASFTRPIGVAVKKNGNIIVVDCADYSLCEIDSDWNVSTIARSEDMDHYGNNRRPHNNEWFYPYGVAIKEDSTILVTSTLDDKIIGINQNGNIMLNIGNHYDWIEDTNNIPEDCFSVPHYLAVKNDGTILVTDSDHFKIKSITPDGIVSTIAGTGKRGCDDGPSLQATFNNPQGIIISEDGTIIIADKYNHKIRGIAHDGIVYTIAGT